MADKKLSIPNMAGKVMTVRGPLDPGTLGFTLMHEHIFFDTRRIVRPVADPTGDASHRDDKLALENLYLARDGKLPDASWMTDERTAIEEVRHFRHWGGDTIVDVSPIGVIRDTLALRRISYATGVNIIMGTGRYARLPYEDMDRITVEELAAEIVEDVVVGIDSSGIRAGIIGEVGIEGNPLTPNEVKVIRGAARASKATGAALTFHRGGVDHEKLRLLELVAEEGADLRRTIIGHADWIACDLLLVKEILRAGAYIEFDLLGGVGAPLAWEPGQEKRPPFHYADASAVARAVRQLIEEGYEDQLLLSQDVGSKLRLKKFGGNGYSFIQEKFVPHLRAGGVGEAQINKMMVDNPRRVLTFGEPS